MERQDLIRDMTFYICMTMIAVLIILYLMLGIKLDAESKQNRINELEQTVEEQYYLIDALQQ